MNRVSKDQWPLPGTYYCPVCKGTNLTYNKYWKCNDCGYFFPNEPPKIRKNRHVPAGVIALLIILAVFFVLGLTYIMIPSSVRATAKGNVSTFFNKFGSPASGSVAITTTVSTPLAEAPFYVYNDGQVVPLKVIHEWNESGNQTIDFTLSNPPAVINYSFSSTNPLVEDFVIYMQQGVVVGSGLSESIISGQTLDQSGKYRLIVDGAGYDWKILIGQ